MTVGDRQVEPGDPVPEAVDWPNLRAWLGTHVEEVPDELMPETATVVEPVPPEDIDVVAVEEPAPEVEEPPKKTTPRKRSSSKRTSSKRKT